MMRKTAGGWKKADGQAAGDGDGLPAGGGTRHRRVPELHAGSGITADTGGVSGEQERVCGEASGDDGGGGAGDARRR